MIDYNRKLSNERETHRMSILVLLETLIFIKKIVSICVMLFYVQYQIPQLVLTAISILHYVACIYLYVYLTKLK